MITRNTKHILSRLPPPSTLISRCSPFLYVVLIFLIFGSGQNVFAQNFEFTLQPEKPEKAIHIEGTPVYLDLSSVESMYTQQSNSYFEGHTFESHIHFYKIEGSFQVELNKIIQQFKMMKNTYLEMIPLQDIEASGTLMHIIHGEDSVHRQVTWIAVIGWRGSTFHLEGTYPLSMHPQLGKKFVAIYQSIYLERN